MLHSKSFDFSTAKEEPSYLGAIKNVRRVVDQAEKEKPKKVSFFTKVHKFLSSIQM